MKVKLIGAFLALSFTMSMNAQVKKWTLKECVDYAIENNITVKQSELNLENAEVDKKGAVGNFLPTVNASASHSWNIGLNQNITTGLLENLTTQFTSARMDVGVSVFAGLQNVNQLHRANLAILSNQYQLEDIKDDIRLLVANSYLQVVFNRESLKVQNAQFESTRQDLERTKELVDSGVVPRGDLLEIEATAATLEQNIVNAENALRLSKISLAQALLITDYENFEISDDDYLVPTTVIFDNNPKSIFEKALTFRNDIKVSELGVQIAEKDVKIAKGGMLPSLDAFYSYDTRASNNDIRVGTDLTVNPDNPTQQIGTVEGTGQAVVAPNFIATPITEKADPYFDQFSINDGHRFGARLSIPILNGFRSRNSVKRSEIALERAKFQFEQEKLNLETTVNQAYNDALGAGKAFEAAQKTLQARQTAFEYSQERFNVGLLNSFDFNQTKQRLIQAEAEVVRTKYNYIFLTKVLEFYFGVPITDIN
ncbi:TolC family protein [Spongiivirga sp. MCCC 1A20706]|uniref:TolC family protein n=1 Tax=Spongiivirga sp. MCCC 1A20706 TaxID=3160963 RepID=UPI003977519B